MKNIFLVFCGALLTLAQATKAQLVSGPWAGNVELRTAVVWVEVGKLTKTVGVVYHPTNNKSKMKHVNYKNALGRDFNPLKIELNNLEPDTEYDYYLVLDGKQVKINFSTKFKTKDLWQFRKPAPDFSFLIGSCAYFNEPAYDRPGKPYGLDSSIFETMANTGGDFHIWLGDNWYTREVDYSSVWGLYYRASKDRSANPLQKFMATMPQYAIWDDHDFGPNDAGKSYLFKDSSKALFDKYFTNPTSGENGEGIYTMFSFSDADFFLTDDRYFRSMPDFEDSIDGKPNMEKSFFGQKQMDWLKNQLLFSKATFKFIAVGSQVLNPLNKFECMTEYAHERSDLLNFIEKHKISGVVFLSGDRHHSEIIALKRDGNYTLYDITASPYSSGIATARGIEKNNPYRLQNTLVEEQNFAKITIAGKKGERKLTVDFIGLKGEKLGKFELLETDISAPKKAAQQ